MYTVLFRDCNGRRFTLTGDNSGLYQELLENTETYNEENCEILFVLFDRNCLYSALSGQGEALTFEELIGFLS